MQTPVFCSDLALSASYLDSKRLNKFIVECKQIYMAITGQSGAWANHPIVRSWMGYEYSLCWYAMSLVNEWMIRNKKSTGHKTVEWWNRTFDDNQIHQMDLELPNWFLDPHTHKMYQAWGLRKNHDHYSKYFDVDKSIPLVYANGTVSKA